MVSRGYIGVAAESTIPPTNEFIQLCKNLKPHFSEMMIGGTVKVLISCYHHYHYSELPLIFSQLFVGSSNRTDRFDSVWY